MVSTELIFVAPKVYCETFEDKSGALESMFTKNVSSYYSNQLDLPTFT